MKADRETIIMAAADHFNIPDIIDSKRLHKKNEASYDSLGFAVATALCVGHYWDVKIWTSIRKFRFASRPKCDHRISIDQDGQVYKKKKAGRKKPVVQHKQVSLQIHPRDNRLLEEVAEYWGKSGLMREAIRTRVYLEQIRWYEKDYSLHIRPLPGKRYGLYRGDGSCISTDTTEIDLLFNLLPLDIKINR